MRKPGEGVGHFEDLAVPASHTQMLARQVRLHNWSALRLVRQGAKHLGDSLPNISSLEDVVNEVSRNSDGPDQWLVRLGEKVMTLGVSEPEVLSLIFSKAYFREEKCLSDLRLLAGAAEHYATDLWAEYRRLEAASELDTHGIILPLGL